MLWEQKEEKNNSLKAIKDTSYLLSSKNNNENK